MSRNKVNNIEKPLHKRSLNEQIIEFNILITSYEEQCNAKLNSLFKLMEESNLQNLVFCLKQLHQNFKDAKYVNEIDESFKLFMQLTEKFKHQSDKLSFLELFNYFDNILALTPTLLFNLAEKEWQSLATSQQHWLEYGMTVFQNRLIQYRKELSERLNSIHKKINETTSVSEKIRIQSELNQLDKIESAVSNAKEKANNLLHAKKLMDLKKAYEDFENYLCYLKKENFADTLNSYAQSKASLHMINTVEQQAKALCLARKSYLPDAQTLRNVLNFIWIGLGIVTCIVGFAISAPFNAVIALGVASVLFGAVDVVRDTAEPLIEATTVSLGQKSSTAEGAITTHTSKTRTQRIFDFFKKITPAVLSVIGLAFTVIGLFIASLSTPMSILGAVITVVAVAVFLREFYLERKQRESMNKNLTAINIYSCENELHATVKNSNTFHNQPTVPCAVPCASRTFGQPLSSTGIQPAAPIVTSVASSLNSEQLDMDKTEIMHPSEFQKNTLFLTCEKENNKKAVVIAKHNKKMLDRKKTSRSTDFLVNGGDVNMELGKMMR